MIKIRTSITEFNLQYLIDHKLHDNETKNRIYDWEEFFRSKLILKINEVFKNSWYLEFTQVREKSWIVDITCEDLKSALIIKSIINISLDDFTIETFYNNKSI
jgi:hypothetical protein